jgi:anthranilate/para-aminobenzoate synthase component I
MCTEKPEIFPSNLELSSPRELKFRWQKETNKINNFYVSSHRQTQFMNNSPRACKFELSAHNRICFSPGFFIQAVGEKDCVEFRKISDGIERIQKPNSTTRLAGDCLSFLKLQELSKHYYRWVH